MKRENFNLIIHTLDDRALYLEICKKLKDMEAVSFKLLCLVPLFSGLSIVILCSLAEKFSSLLLILTAVFGALVTFFIFRWEKRNLQMRDIFRSYAEILETKKIQLESENLPHDAGMGGPYSLLRNRGKPMLWHAGESLKGWGKTEAETAIYSTTILFWLLLPVLAFYS